ncbi:tRNA(adenine(34)) deaminase, chloroplastic [Neltuma alba]|uniref:tRNA(adenine(34)) deaminase, chloroplastic n=1 Tax=Neltuma alba TaxID=207710 RepID=UPI0010A35DED|nr:tRNA(adenine(34)) deaminase, chloroplastic [Prosopis alba]XP_028776390.1 tRNA(adenine(34)) deaminase, chloroplastic [Prosopis alba]
MHNAYFSSTIYAIRSKSSFSLSFNDYPNVSCERFDRVPSCRPSCCGCCHGCALSTCRVSLNPSLLFGLRQSTLLQLSASRRLILDGRDRYFSQLAAYGLNRDCYELDCSFSERSVPNRSKRRINQRFFCSVSEEESGTNHSFGSDDAESVISLLSEEADGNFTCFRAKNVSSSKNLDMEKKRKNWRRERNQNSGKKEVKKGNLKHLETLTRDLRKEDEKLNEEKKAVAKGGHHGKRRDVSSCSSYYSFSSLGDMVSDLEVEDKHGKFLEELSVEEDKTSHMEEQVKEEFNRLRNDSEKLEEISNQERTAYHADIDCSLRKKSEKKLTEVTTEEKLGKEPQDIHPRLSGRHESGYGKASTSHKQFESEDDTSSLIRNSLKKAREDQIQISNRRKYQSTEIQESDGYEAELKNTFGGREGNLEISGTLFREKNYGQKSFVDSSTRKDVLSKNNQKNFEKSIIEGSEVGSNTRMKNLEEDKTSVRSSVGNMEEHHYQKGDRVITQIEGRRKFQLSELSQVQETNVETASTVKSSNIIKNQKDNLKLYSHVKGVRHGTDMKAPQSRKQSELVHSVSKGHASNEKLVSRSQGVSDEMRLFKDSSLTSINARDTRESYCQTDERITLIKSSNEAQQPTNQSILDENISKEAQSSRESLNLVSEGRKQYVILAEGGESSSDAMFVPSSSKLMRRGSTRDELDPGTSIPEVRPNTSESVSSALYTNSGGRSPALQYELCSTDGSSQVYSDALNILAPEDALASADRLEKSSKQFVDEFVQKARHEVVPETQEMEITGTKLSTEDEKNQFYCGRQQNTQKVSKSRERDSSHSSGFSGAKGPSDEMWDEPESSIKQSPPAEEAEASLVRENSIVKRTGRTLWGIIADVVRLRWHSRADDSTSASKSGERDSSNKSDNDTWFSGQEPEEAGKSKVIKERTSVRIQATTPDQLQPQKSHTQNEGDVFDTMKLTDKGEHLEAGTSFSPNELGSGSTSMGISSATGEGNASWTEDGKDFRVSTSGAGTMELSIPLPARPPLVEEIVDTGGTESLGRMEDPVAPKQTEISVMGRRDAELKQRKLQRNKQVIRDRFDEWEEAYKLELEQRRMDEVFMREALLEAKKAADTWEVPVGAVLVRDGKIIARGCNLVEELRDSTAHAEMICIREASNLLRTWRLAGTTLYVTLEPCPMCAGAILQARIETLVWGAPNKLLGSDGSWVRLFPDGGENRSETKEKPAAPVHPFHPKMNIRRGVLASECAEVMQQFFQLRRKKKKEPSPSQPSQTSHHHPSKLLQKMHNIFHMMFCL